MIRTLIFLTLLAAIGCATEPPAISTSATEPEIVIFPSGKRELRGVLYKPAGKGPFPAILYNHGSAPGMQNAKAAEELGPLYAKHGWVFFMPYRRGQGLSAGAGPYIMDEVNAAKKRGRSAAAATLAKLLATDHLNDQLSALEWLKAADSVVPTRIATAGNSLGGIQAVLGAGTGAYCAAVDAAGAAQSWAESAEIRKLMLDAAKGAKAPIFFFQARNDYDIAPTEELSAAMKAAGKPATARIYPPYGNSNADGHAFAYLGSTIWESDVFAFLNELCSK